MSHLIYFSLSPLSLSVEPDSSCSLRPNGTAIETAVARDGSKASLVRERIMGIFDCSWSLLQKLNRLSFPTIRKVNNDVSWSLQTNVINILNTAGSQL